MKWLLFPIMVDAGVASLLVWHWDVITVSCRVAMAGMVLFLSLSTYAAYRDMSERPDQDYKSSAVRVTGVRFALTIALIVAFGAIGFIIKLS
jgi:hypothetical protein